MARPMTVWICAFPSCPLCLGQSAIKEPFHARPILIVVDCAGTGRRYGMASGEMLCSCAESMGWLISFCRHEKASSRTGHMLGLTSVRDLLETLFLYLSAPEGIRKVVRTHFFSQSSKPSLSGQNDEIAFDVLTRLLFRRLLCGQT